MDSSASLRPRRVVVNGSSGVSRILDAVQRTDADLAERLLVHIRANVRTLREEEVPLETLSEDMVTRVAKSRETAAQRSKQLQIVRDRLTPLLQNETREACARLTEEAKKQGLATDIGAKLPDDHSAENKLRADGRVKAVELISNAKSSKMLCGRIEKLRKDALVTRKRANNALDTLRIIAESEGCGDDNNTVTISMDGDELTLPLNPPDPSDDARAVGAEEDSIPIPVSPDARSMRRAARASLPGDPAVSPHITPRSKTRRRLLGSPAASKSKLPR